MNRVAQVGMWVQVGLLAVTLAACGDSGTTGDTGESAGATVDDTAAEEGPLATAGATIRALASDGEHVFWIEHADETEAFALWRAAIDTGTPELLAETTYEEPQWGLETWLEVDGGDVFWTWPGTEKIRAIPTDGGSVVTVADAVAGPGDLGVGPDHVFWSEDQSRLMRAPRAGGAAPEEVALVEFLTGIEADGEGVYAMARLYSYIEHHPYDGGEPEIVAGWTGDNTMNLDGGPTHLVWSDNSNGELLTWAKAGGEVTVIADEAATMLGHVGVGAEHVVVGPGFWDFVHTVRLFRLDGTGEPLTLGDPGEACAAAVAIDAKAAFWSDCDGGIHRHPLPAD